VFRSYGAVPESSGGWMEGGLKHSEWMVAGRVPRRKLKSRVAEGSECTRMMVPMSDAEAIMVPSGEKASIACHVHPSERHSERLHVEE
jgi:hypothetical protein